MRPTIADQHAIASVPPLLPISLNLISNQISNPQMHQLHEASLRIIHLTLLGLPKNIFFIFRKRDLGRRYPRKNVRKSNRLPFFFCFHFSMNITKIKVNRALNTWSGSRTLIISLYISARWLFTRFHNEQDIFSFYEYMRCFFMYFIDYNTHENKEE